MSDHPLGYREPIWEALAEGDPFRLAGLVGRAALAAEGGERGALDAIDEFAEVTAGWRSDDPEPSGTTVSAQKGNGVTSMYVGDWDPAPACQWALLTDGHEACERPADYEALATGPDDVWRLCARHVEELGRQWPGLAEAWPEIGRLAVQPLTRRRG